jgi:hypothetical protein
MFWQSFLGVFTTNPNVSPMVPSLAIYTQSNTYVLPGVYIGSATPSPTAVNPFAVTPVTPVVVPSSGNYLPTVEVKTSFSSYEPWTIDFQSANTVVWADNCTQALLNNNNVSCT